MTDSKTIYTVGGTVQASGGLYIQRAADQELLELCRQGELTFILSSRQVGKSSLMVRTAEQLKKEDVRSVIIDLSAIGVKVTPDEWYLGILNEIANTLDLETDIFTWWGQRKGIGPAQRMSNFFRDILLKEVSQRVVLFFDEIDSTLSIPFSDDFFIALRATYNARSISSEYTRLSFVLIGVATPSDLISDSKRTPFNVGQRVDLTDFTLEEAKPLAKGLGDDAEQVLGWVFDWTGGHPYLTQRLCAYLARSNNSLSKEDVANAVVELFLGERGNQDNNIQFVRDMLIYRSPDTQEVLKTYKNIRLGKNIPDDEHSTIKSHLKLSGVVRSDREKLQVRNRIYNSVFDLQWIREVTPRNWARTTAIVFASFTIILLSILIYDMVFVSRNNQDTINNFYNLTEPSEKLKGLANLFDPESILIKTDYSFQARDLFYGLSWDEQTALFKDPQIALTDKQKYLPVVVNGLYVTFANIGYGQDSSELLQIMRDSLRNVGTANSGELQSEINLWLEARVAQTDQDAFDKYGEAINIKGSNPATHYERARVALGLGMYEQALLDLDATISLAQNLSSEESEQEIPIPTSTSEAIFQSTESLAPEMPSKTINPQPTSFNQDLIATSLLEPELVITPTFTPTPTPENREGYRSSFNSMADIRSAVNSVLQEIMNRPEFDLLISTDYTNLREAGLIAQTTVAPSETTPDLQETFSPTSNEVTPRIEVISSPTPNPVNFVLPTVCVQPAFDVISVNVRTGPRTDTGVIGNAPALDVGKCPLIGGRNEEDTWYMIAYNQPNPEFQPYEGGWIRKDLFDLSTPVFVPEITLTPTPMFSPTPAIPSSNLTSPITIEHLVVSGEWLWQIAHCYGANPEEVQIANPQIADLDSEIPSGTVIIVPDIGSVGTIYGPPCIGTHTVQSGDTWTLIAQLYNADPKILLNVNPGELSVGRVLIVPLNSADGALTSTITP